jgi:hypothetical protein
VDLGAVTAACLVLPGGDDDRRGDAVVFRPMHIETWQFENRLGQTDRITIGAASQDEFHLVEDVEAMAGVTDKMSRGQTMVDSNVPPQMPHVTAWGLSE